MQTLAVRVEASSGSYTDTPGQTRAVFDTRVVAGYVETEDGNINPTCTEDGRDAVLTSKGAAIYINEYDSNVANAPDDYSVLPIEKGMYIDNVTPAGRLSEAAVALCEKGGAWKIFSVIGEEDVAELVTQLSEMDSVNGKYLGSLVLIAVNHAGRDIPG